MTRRSKSKPDAITEELPPVRKKRTKTKNRIVRDMAVSVLANRSGGVKRLMKVTEGVERLIWAMGQTDEDEVAGFNETKMSDDEILLAAQIASALIIIVDGLEVGG